MRRRTMLLATLAAVLVVAGLLAFRALGSSSDSTAPTSATAATARATAPDPSPRPSIPGTAAAAVSGEDAAAAVCAVRPTGLEGLTRIASKSPRLENLRDGLPLLHDRIVQVQLSAEGRPALIPLTRRLSRIYQDWSTALQQHDAGHAHAAAVALAAADQQITAMTTELNHAFPAQATACGVPPAQ